MKKRLKVLGATTGFIILCAGATIGFLFTGWGPLAILAASSFLAASCAVEKF